MMREFGELLRKQRREASKTMADLAELLDVSVPYISDVERGRRAPFRLDRLEKIATYLGTDVDELHEAAALAREAFELDAVNVSQEARQVGAALMRGWTNLTPAQIEEIRKVVAGGDG